MRTCLLSKQCGMKGSNQRSHQMVRRSAVILLVTVLWSEAASVVMAQELAAPDLERAAAAEVQRREAFGSLTRFGSVRVLDANVAHPVDLRSEAAPRGRAVDGPMADHQPDVGLNAVARSVNHELTDIARAFRRLDQSYAIRGFQGCAASTAGSVFVDWRAKGIAPQHHPMVLPPAPIILSQPKPMGCSATIGCCDSSRFSESSLPLRCHGPAVVYVHPIPSAGKPCCESNAQSPLPLSTSPTPLETRPPALP
jgi:hypothetical protein